ncbi:MAG: alanine racemase [Crocinitomicaceae bacterium]
MNLDYHFHEIAAIFGQDSKEDAKISSVAFDSRKIVTGEGMLFFALEGIFRNGHDFIQDAYNKGVRFFVVSDESSIIDNSDAHFSIVTNSLEALQNFAKHHRSRFSCEVVAITGSNGKTTVKEWLSHLLNKQFVVAKSPKSYNSKLGVALSLLEITTRTEVAIIEVGISSKGEMEKLIPIIQPTQGILTSFGTGHRELFDNEWEHFDEKIALFKNLKFYIHPANVVGFDTKNGIGLEFNAYSKELTHFIHNDKTSIQNAQLAIRMANEFNLSEVFILESIPELNSLALRMETYDGINENLIINDTYNLDLESLQQSLEYQLTHSNGKERAVIIGLTEDERTKENVIRSIVENYKPEHLIFFYPSDKFNFQFEGKSILIKGTRLSKMERIARELKKINHQTYLEIDLKCIRHNINYTKSLLNDSTQLLCMLKAHSYGSDAKSMGIFLEGMGVDYFGVAYPDEGILLRESGIKTPILVMNCEESTFSSIIEYNLEPAIFSVTQLDKFITELIYRSKENYPIHVKIETGMNRLGFAKKEISVLIDLVKSQPEIYIKSIYSHLAEADVTNSAYTEQQINLFDSVSSDIQSNFNTKIIRHLLNSEGIHNYTYAQFDMVRLGIGMYGVLGKDTLRSAIKWFSTISQVKLIEKGSSIGYGRSFITETVMKIAVIPLGYADGYRRMLGQGIGGVFINEQYCPTVGNVCMDMIMVDVSNVDVKPGSQVEIIGNNISMLDMAKKLNTIPYEIMTSFSARMHRVFIDQ